MQTKTEVKFAFMAELMALLAKYNATIDARDHWEGYPECGEDVRMTATIPAVYNIGHERVRGSVEADL